MADGSSLPSDYNGPRENCSDLGNAVIKNLSIVKTCNGNAYPGCIPDYDGNDTIKKQVMIHWMMLRLIKQHPVAQPGERIKF